MNVHENRVQRTWHKVRVSGNLVTLFLRNENRTVEDAAEACPGLTVKEWALIRAGHAHVEEDGDAYKVVVLIESPTPSRAP